MHIKKITEPKLYRDKMYPLYVVNNTNGSDGNVTNVFVCVDIIKQKKNHQNGKKNRKRQEMFIEYISYRNALIKIPFPQAYDILTVVGAKTLFVADRGRLVGLVTWSEVSGVSGLMCI